MSCAAACRILMCWSGLLKRNQMGSKGGRRNPTPSSPWRQLLTYLVVFWRGSIAAVFCLDGASVGCCVFVLQAPFFPTRTPPLPQIPNPPPTRVCMFTVNNAPPFYTRREARQALQETGRGSLALARGRRRSPRQFRQQHHGARLPGHDGGPGPAVVGRRLSRYRSMPAVAVPAPVPVGRRRRR